ncbi:MAG: metalloregulator ArsR/SmtB family transcription factor [Pseudomonadota bacterium]
MDIQSHQFFHALSDLTRLRCLALMHAQGEVCVCEMTRVLALSQPKISRHLALLRDIGLVEARRDGVWMHYRIHPALPDWARTVLDTALPVCSVDQQSGAEKTACSLPASGNESSTVSATSDLASKTEGEMDKVYNVLFLCTGNSARSIMAEALLNHWGKGRFQAYSGGSHPRGVIAPQAINLLARVDLPTQDLRSKSWDEFAQPGAPEMDFVFTVCDQAKSEVCPAWPGQPMTAHWGVPDPVAVEGDEVKQMQAFREAFRVMENRIKLFAALPVAQLDSLRVKSEIDAIGTAMPVAE